MKVKIVGILVCLLLILTVLPASGTRDEESIVDSTENIGVRGGYKSLIDISSPDGTKYICIMFCDNHQQTLEWKYLIDDLGFEKTWIRHLMKITIFFVIPGTILLFGLDDFREWCLELFIKLKYKEEFLDFISNYDESNESGMITYLWLTGEINRPVDFKSQPDNSWVNNSWILDDNGVYIPNPEIWDEPFFWYFDIPSR